MNNYDEELLKNLKNVMGIVKSKYSIFLEFYIYYSVEKLHYFNCNKEDCTKLQSGIGMYIKDRDREHYYYTDIEKYEQLLLWLDKRYHIFELGIKEDNKKLKQYGYRNNIFEDEYYLEKLKSFRKMVDSKALTCALYTNFEFILIYNNNNFCTDGRAFQKIFFYEDKKIKHTFSLNQGQFIGDVIDCAKCFLSCKQKNDIFCLFNYKIEKIILFPRAAGALIHEICGHMLENEYYKKGNFFYGKIDHKIAPVFLTVHDNPKLLYGNVNHVDDEGFELTKNTIIKRGILKGIIGDEIYRMKNEQFRCFRQSRKESYEYLSTGRTFCLEVEPGKRGRQEVVIENCINSLIVYSFDKSYYNVSTRKGYFQTNSFFVMEDGELKKVDQILRINLSGQTILDNILELSNDNEYCENMCYASSGYVSNATYCPTFVLGMNNMKVKYHRDHSITIK